MRAPAGTTDAPRPTPWSANGGARARVVWPTCSQADPHQRNKQLCVIHGCCQLPGAFQGEPEKAAQSQQSVMVRYRRFKHVACIASKALTRDSTSSSRRTILDSCSDQHETSESSMLSSKLCSMSILGTVVVRRKRATPRGSLVCPTTRTTIMSCA